MHYRAGFGPLPSGIFPAPFPYASRSPLADYRASACHSCSCSEKFSLQDGCKVHGCESKELAAAEVERCLRELELMLRTQTAPSETACIIIEPVLGEGGYVPPPPGYLQGVRDICDRNDILLIMDEVQTGFGRTGTLFASEWLDVKPDIIVCAKGLANGFPLSAVGTRKELSDHQPPGSMGGTYGGNAVACAAANAVFDIIETENVLENCNARGDDIRRDLSALALEYPSLLREVRGRGLMIGVEFNQSYFEEGSVTTGQIAGLVTKKCWEKNLLILSCGPYDVVRMIPPLNISKADADTCMSIFREAVRETVAELSS